MELKIKYIPVSDLEPYAGNPRINDSAIPAVRESIKEFGFKIPIVIDAKNVIIAGHTRLEAAKELGLERVPCIVADDLNEEQIRAFRLADNKTSELSGWDFAMLEEELEGIGAIDMTLFGFAEDAEGIDIDSYFEASEERADKEPKRIQCPHCGEWIEL